MLRFLISGLIPVLSLSAQAASIQWQTPQGISGTADVSNTGTAVIACNLNGASTVLNGVTFNPLGSATNFTAANAMVTGNMNADTNSGNSSAPFSSLPSDYQLLLGTGLFSGHFDGLTLTLSGLTPGSQYLFQTWSHFSDPFAYGTYVSTHGDPDLAIYLDNGTTGLGQHLTGTFTADAATQVIRYQPDELLVLNAFQLRAIPEPGSAVLAGLAIWALGSRRYRHG